MIEVSSAGPVRTGELALIAEQLWPGLDSSDLRVSSGAADDEDWRTIEEFGLALWRGRVGMVLPRDRRIAARTLNHYARLRPARRRVIRRVWSRIIAIGTPGVWATVQLQARKGSPSESTRTVMMDVAGRSGIDHLHMTMSVRRTANRKALLQIVNEHGALLSFAKLGWNEVSSVGVQTEARALRRLGGGRDTLRTPQVIDDAVVNGFPYLLVEPLPVDVYRIGPASPEGPTLTEFETIAPRVRNDRAVTSGHVRRMRARLEAARGEAENSSSLASLIEATLDDVERNELIVPIAAHWHGDFAFWNVARTPDRTLWCWDLENADDDALVGLDVFHWNASRMRRLEGAMALANHDALLTASVAMLRGLGLEEESWRLVQRAYLAEIGLRAIEMAASDGWRSVWAEPFEIEMILQGRT